MGKHRKNQIHSLSILGVALLGTALFAQAIALKRFISSLSKGL